MKLAIVIPAYNEEKRIAKTLKSYLEFFNTLAKKKKVQYELLVAINNTKDATLSIVKSFKKKHKHLSYLDLEKGGKGYAVIEGFKYFIARKKYDLIGFVDADLATKPEDFFSLVSNMQGYDGSIASRYVPGAVVKPKQSWQRIFVSRIFNLYLRTLLFLPYRDTQCGAKVFKTNALKAILPKVSMSQWAFDVELLYLLKKQGFHIKELPTVWSDQAYSKINFVKAGPKMALSIMRLRLLYSPFKSFIRVYNALLQWLQS